MAANELEGEIENMVAKILDALKRLHILHLWSEWSIHDRYPVGYSSRRSNEVVPVGEDIIQKRHCTTCKFVQYHKQSIYVNR